MDLHIKSEKRCGLLDVLCCTFCGPLAYIKKRHFTAQSLLSEDKGGCFTDAPGTANYAYFVHAIFPRQVTRIIATSLSIDGVV
jgi:hypothetical protein